MTISPLFRLLLGLSIGCFTGLSIGCFINKELTKFVLLCCCRRADDEWDGPQGIPVIGSQSQQPQPIPSLSGRYNRRPTQQQRGGYSGGYNRGPRYPQRESRY